jgi:hypothetical protein
MMRVYIAIPLLWLSIVTAALSAPAEKTLAQQYDTTKTVTLTGIVYQMWFQPDTPFCIVLETKDADEKSQKWLVAGDSATTLQAEGWRFGPPGIGTLMFNQKITVTAYLPKKNSKAADDLASASPQLADALKNAKLVHGIEITLSSGKKMPFGAAK